MWIRSQNGEELVEASRIKAIRLENGDVNILAKLPRETVILGTYGNIQAGRIMLDIWAVIKLPERIKDSTETWFRMPERCEEDK